ncbi:thiamine-phosphate diphosphorylase [Microbacterium terrae]|uniref:Thiamine-phosphate synthase n=1 Tax=Microbacterium terrae TaxID=69369 RepID=A0A0M2H2I8_9MICO|nr:thiamine phosphate synthase [Microbacterium terrae]KJL37763.1 Thiamine-phosphate synthase [Microbacterium terrae]MBP1076595.1 thiamine-phosphate diphosphorylase [Microbacterium terrae]GLJ97423.1 thiamine-phosphate synthase [Microbacterium terrae]
MTVHDLSLHLVTDERLPFERLVGVVDAAAAGGVGVVQLRAKHVSARELIAQAVALSAVVGGRAALIVDDRLDVVLAARDAGACVDGVHLGQSDVPPETARRLLGAQALIGWTANTPAHLASAAAMPMRTLDYIGVGVIRPTATKADHPEPLGYDGFAALASATPLPCVAIGGVGVADAAPLRSAGAAGLAVVSAVCGAADPEAAARAFRSAWTDAGHSAVSPVSV